MDTPKLCDRDFTVSCSEGIRDLIDTHVTPALRDGTTAWMLAAVVTRNTLCPV